MLLVTLKCLLSAVQVSCDAWWCFGDEACGKMDMIGCRDNACVDKSFWAGGDVICSGGGLGGGLAGQ